MRWIIVVYLVVAVGVASLFAVKLFPIPDNETCNFCSGSGAGEDCPRDDTKAKRACMASVRDHYCGQRPSECDGPPTIAQRNFQ